MRTAKWQSQPANLCSGWCVTSIWSGKLNRFTVMQFSRHALRLCIWGGCALGGLALDPQAWHVFALLQ